MNSRGTEGNFLLPNQPSVLNVESIWQVTNCRGWLGTEGIPRAWDFHIIRMSFPRSKNRFRNLEHLDSGALAECLSGR